MCVCVCVCVCVCLCVDLLHVIVCPLVSFIIECQSALCNMDEENVVRVKRLEALTPAERHLVRQQCT